MLLRSSKHVAAQISSLAKARWSLIGGWCAVECQNTVSLRACYNLSQKPLVASEQQEHTECRGPKCLPEYRAEQLVVNALAAMRCRGGVMAQPNKQQGNTANSSVTPTNNIFLKGGIERARCMRQRVYTMYLTICLPVCL